MPYTTPAGRHVSVLGVLFFVVACGGSPPPASSSVTPPADLSTVLTVTVRNQQLEEARTWIWVDGRRVSLGSVRPNTSQTFYVPLDGVRRLHLEFDVTLGMRCLTRDASFGPGESVEVRIPSNLAGFVGVCQRR